MPQDKELLDAVRKDYPELQGVPDAELYQAVLKDFPELQPKAEATKSVIPDSWKDVRFPGMPSPNDLLGALKGGGKALGDFVQTGGQWMENIAGMPVSAPRTTPTGRDVFQPNTTQEKIGKVLGQTGLAMAGGAAGGPMASQVAAGGLMGAMQNPDAPYGPAAAGMAAPIAVGAVEKYAPMVKALMGGREAGGEKFNQIAQQVKGANIQTDPLAQELVQADLLSKTGSTPPKVIKDLFKWEGPIDYEAAGRFANRAGRLTVAEKLDTDKAMKATVTRVYDALKQGRRAEAAKVGMGELYDQATREYAMGMKGVDMKDALMEVLKNRGVEAAIGAGTLYAIYKALGK